MAASYHSWEGLAARRSSPMAAASLLTTTARPNPSAAHTPSGHRWPARASVPFPHRFPAAPTVHLGVPDRLHQRRQQQGGRGDCLLARAGPPSTATLVFVFVFPLSLVIGTIFASARIAYQLDEKFLQELAMNKAIMEEKEEGEDEAPATLEDEQFITAPMEVASAAPRTRNRPKREA
ncbi:hypothetical protein Taro_004736 [Colocasia esculenta]|uniref:High chlorophyll fluorescence 153 n=1 Tax=Colocasia esculenta TaxID=4460 RepID=A0A843TL10_COLES|nr:hypothetical protein [Colocasia esculenta]